MNEIKWNEWNEMKWNEMKWNGWMNEWMNEQIDKQIDLRTKYMSMPYICIFIHLHTFANDFFSYLDVWLRKSWCPAGPGRHIWWWRRSTTRGNSPIWSMATMVSKISLNPTLQRSSNMQRLGESLGEWLKYWWCLRVLPLGALQLWHGHPINNILAIFGQP